MMMIFDEIFKKSCMMNMVEPTSVVYPSMIKASTTIIVVNL